MWHDLLPMRSIDQETLDIAEKEISRLDEEAVKLSWDQDVLKLSKDVATLGRLLEKGDQCERTRHLKKVLHLKAQSLASFNIFVTQGFQFIPMKTWRHVVQGTASALQWSPNIWVAGSSMSMGSNPNLTAPFLRPPCQNKNQDKSDLRVILFAPAVSR